MPRDLYWKTPNEEAETQTGIIWQDHGNCPWHECFCPADLRTCISAQRRLCSISLGWPYTQHRGERDVLKLKPSSPLSGMPWHTKLTWVLPRKLEKSWDSLILPASPGPVVSVGERPPQGTETSKKAHGSGQWPRFIGPISHLISIPKQARVKNQIQDQKVQRRLPPSPPSDRAKKSFLFTTPNKAITVLITAMKVKPSPMLGATTF